MKIRTLLKTAKAAVLVASLGLAAAWAQGYPDKPVRLVVGFPPGGTTDVLARIVAVKLSEKLGQQFIVDNRAGAGGMIGTDAVAKAAPDGYTLLFTSSTLATYKSLYAKVPFDPARDLAPIGMVATTPYVLVVNPKLPVKSLSELISYAKAHPGEINYAASAPGGGQQLAWEMLKRNTQTNMVYVPYKGTGALMPDLLGGTLQAGIDNVAVLVPHIKSGALRPIVVTGAQRTALLPDVPTAVESGQSDFKVIGWFGLMAPAKTPPAVVQRVSTALSEIVNQKDVQAHFLELGGEADTRDADAMRKLIASETERWGKLIREAGITAQ
ncbi:MAG: tripartite tricarboxylate transporter substrate binding protein [Proteobacteria bacterium]|nr:tripartite tricarboxylate transporter substrate binding protein [Pseudomonadota bacterium]